MAINWIGSMGTTVESIADTDVALVFAAGAVPGDQIIVELGWRGGAPGFLYIGASDTAGNTWNLADQVSTAGGAASGILYCTVTNAITIGNTLTITFNGASQRKALAANKWTGIDFSSLVHATATGTSITASATLPAPTPEGGLVVASMCSIATTMTAGSGCTEIAQYSPGQISWLSEYLIAPTTTTYSPDVAISTSLGWTMTAVSFAAAVQPLPHLTGAILLAFTNGAINAPAVSGGVTSAPIGGNVSQPVISGSVSGSTIEGNIT